MALPVSMKNIDTHEALLPTLNEERGSKKSDDTRYNQVVAQKLTACHAQSFDDVTSEETSSSTARNSQ